MADYSVYESEEEDATHAGVSRWLISCDESGINGTKYYGFGTLWMRWQRRGDFAALVRDLRYRHRFPDIEEFKWNKVNLRFLPFYKHLVELFFRRRWLAFHCLVIRRAVVDKSRHNGDWDVARRKQLGLLLTNKIERCVRAHPDREQTFRVWTDPLPSRYAKAHEAMGVIANNALRRVLGERPVDKVFEHDSREKPQIQLCDLLLGAVMEAWQQRAGAPKLELARFIAEHLGWMDLRADTRAVERKFNIWYYKPHGARREVSTRPVRLTYPLPPRNGVWHRAA